MVPVSGTTGRTGMKTAGKNIGKDVGKDIAATATVTATTTMIAMSGAAGSAHPGRRKKAIAELS